MSKEGMEEFIDAVRKDASLRTELGTIIAFLAQERGHDVEEEDVQEFLNELPAARPLPGHDDVEPPGLTTLALGEEEGDRDRIVTEAIGEDGRVPPGATTEAVGEEGGRPRPRPSTEAVGEEGGRMSTMAVGEEGGRFRGPRK